MDNKSLEDELKDKLFNLCQFAWESRVDWIDIAQWLSNFVGKVTTSADERLHMLHLLSQFSYFGAKEVRALIRAMYRDKFRTPILHEVRRRNSNTKDIDFLEDRFESTLKQTRFVSVGNPSESSTHLLYYFRQENQLPKSVFANSIELFNLSSKTLALADPSIERYVFVDDLCGSGKQALEYLKSLVDVIKQHNPNSTVYYLTLCATEAGLRTVRGSTSIDVVECVYEFDDTYKAFDDDSRYFVLGELEISKETSKSIAQNYGEHLEPDHALGFENCQLLLGFHHNTPNNTLPLFWCDDPTSPWIPIFPRYNKVYEWEKQ